MRRKVLLFGCWFILTTLVLAFNITLLIQSSKPLEPKDDEVISMLPDDSVTTGYQIASSLGSSQVLGAQVISGDARAKLLENFLIEYNSPLTQYSQLIVEHADLNNIDYRLLVAIAMCESNVGKRIPSDSHNAWGIAVYTGQQDGAVFQDWPTAIAWVSRFMREKFYNQGITDLQTIGEIYAPPSIDTDHSWTKCVEGFRDGIQ